MHIPNYIINNKLYEGRKTLVYRALRRSDDKPVIIKTYQKSQTENRNSLKHEYDLLQQLNIAGVVKPYELVSFEGNAALILEDIGGITLSELIEEDELSLISTLQIAVAVSHILGAVHKQGIIHKDINPGNIIINPNTEQVQLIDFSIAYSQSKTAPLFTTPNRPEGTLAYISPEQTGRMNRLLDYRTDLYSLGVTLYQMLSGQLPFQITDPIALVHSHIAVQPRPLAVLKADIPVMLSDIVQILLAKNPEDRYQSSWGLKADLEICLNDLRETGNINRFTLKRLDVSGILLIPQKLYGRQSEAETLLNAFQRIKRGRAELVLVSGASGMGKTTLINTLHSPVMLQQGNFISGKFDQLEQNVPYSAFIQAFEQLINHLLTQDELQLAGWKNSLQERLGVNTGLIAEVIPAIELIVGPQPKPVNLASDQARNRFEMMFERFIGLFAQAEHPLVIFIDDLQWADADTLRMVELLLKNSARCHLLIIGALRVEEAERSLLDMIQNLKEADVPVTQISLYPLSHTYLSNLIAETLNYPPETTHSLAQIVYRKTEGNPFFVNEFLKTIYQNSLLSFELNTDSVPEANETAEHQLGAWRWNLQDIDNLAVTKNVVSLMLERIKKLPPETQNILHLAACIGNVFDLEILALISEESTSQSFYDLWPALQAGLVVPITDLRINPSSDELALEKYQFLHDQVQTAAYQLVGKQSRQLTHLKIGRMFLNNFSPEEQYERIFDVVNHLNQGKVFVTDIDDIYQLVEFNLAAGIRAKSAIAYAPALEYISTGVSLLPLNSWDSHYKLTLDLYLERMELEFLNGYVEESHETARIMLEQVNDILEKTRIYSLLVVHYTLQGGHNLAISSGLQALKLLDIELIDVDLKAILRAELSQAQEHLLNFNPAVVINNPLVPSPQIKEALRILSNTRPSAYQTNAELFDVIAVKMFNLSVQHGHTPESAAGYSGFGIILADMGQTEYAYQLGNLALQLSKKLNDQTQLCRAALIHGTFLSPWVKHIKESKALHEVGYQAGLIAGELQFTGYIIAHRTMNAFYQGENLLTITSAINSYLSEASQIKNQYTKDSVLALLLPVTNLQGNTSNLFDFDTPGLSQETFLKNCQTYQSYSANCLFHLLKAQVLYLYHYPAQANKHLKKAQTLLTYLRGTIVVAQCTFFQSLILAALYPQTSEDEQAQIWLQLQANISQLELWATTCPANFSALHLLVKAEMASLSEAYWEAIQLYDEAIALAGIHGFRQIEALANELAGLFWLKHQKPAFAQPYLNNAYHHYQFWGALRKAQLLKEKHKTLLTDNQPSAKKERDTTTTNDPGTLDMVSVMKASQAISGEIVFNKLLVSLMKIVLENAGAEKGMILLEQEGRLTVKAGGNVETGSVRMFDISPEEPHEDMAYGIVNYVRRTRESVVLDNAVYDNRFSTDSYVISERPKSILCTPIIKQGNLIGIIYLENNLVSKAFTAQRLEMLNLLSAQIAISLDNARLYAEMEQEIIERKQAEQALLASEEQLKTYAAELERSNRELEDFAYISSHDLQEPLRKIGVMSDHLLRRYKDVLDDHGQLYLERLQLAAKRSQTLITELLAFSQLTARAEPFKSVNLSQVVEEVLIDLETQIEELNGTVYVQDLPTIQAEPTQMRQLFQNLISNALKFHRPEVPPVLHINSQIEQLPASLNQICVISVIDNGIGFDEQYVGKIFTLFQRLHNADDYQGTGIGLAVCEKIVQWHQGSITAHSELNRGTTFLIRLPLIQNNAQEEK